jgi:hypothetical protein
MNTTDSLRHYQPQPDDPYDDCLEEKFLLVAIIERAILDYLELSCEKSDTESAKNWILCYKEHPFSFHWCCIQLSMEPRAVRDTLALLSSLPKEKLREGNRFDTHDRLGQLIETQERPRRSNRLNSVTRFNLLKKQQASLSQAKSA